MSLRTLSAVLVFGCAVALAADWLSYGGDPQGTNWQRHGKELTVDNVKNLKLLWKRQLNDQSKLSSPIIIGPTITHRGVRELVFVASRDNLFAVDADLGTLFWTRHFEAQSKTRCGDYAPPTPVLEPDPDEDFSGAPMAEDDDDDDPGEMRPLYAVDSDGRLHTIRVSDGADTSAHTSFVPPDANYSPLNFWNGTVYARALGGCNNVPDGLWSIDVRPGGKTKYSKSEGSQVVIGPAGKIYSSVASAAFRYDDRELIVSREQDRLLLLDAAKLNPVTESPIPHGSLGVASWRGNWIYAATSRDLRAFRLSGPSSRPKLELAWSADIANPGRPVVANGVVFVPTSSAVIALNAASGKLLYTNESAAYPHAPVLAVANGHICFTDSRNVLYCYGLPLER